MPVVDASGLAQKMECTYCEIGKRKLKLDAFYPKQKSNGIAIIIIHGGGWRSGNRTQHHDMAKALANKGYACFTPEYRLSPEAYFPAAIFDIKEAIKWIKIHAKDFRVDSAKLVVAGFSAGGQMAALVGCTGDMPTFENYDQKNAISTKVKAIIDIDGTTSFVHAESSEQKNPSAEGASAYWLGYTPKDNPLLWATASPLSYAVFSPPILFLNSSVDRMHAGRDDYIKILQERNVLSRVHTFENSPHSFCLFEPWFTPAVNYIDDFLKINFSL
ncbi:alpha/beta hydrolase [Niabella hibiscisoli]|uniref:alpha/beta hydrolase n=1 Tax=Niabella hibiscisoli TaxID=1825928 RepID=UPI001F114B48|nr:alpha/beta hydrolase [Niabella hibiscisoli]MCH5715704.1 alpha/beta hydrolase [Niabella hibiscisoli]